MARIEIRVRRFMICDEGFGATPMSAVTCDEEVAGAALAELLNRTKELLEEMRDFPATNLRPMTDEQVFRCLANEKDEQKVPTTLIPLMPESTL